MRLNFFKKFFVIFSILAIQGFFLYAFYINEGLIFNFKTAYLTKVYLPSYTRLLNNFKSNTNDYLASAVMIFNRGDNSNVITLASNQNIYYAKSIPVLIYHGIVEEPDKDNVRIDNFKDQMFTLKKAGWQTVSIEDFYAFMQGNKELPDKSFLLTFDDGRKDSYYPVDPILKALDYRAVIYIITGRSLSDDLKTQDHPFHLNEAEIRKMYKSGRWDIQAHTKNGHDFYSIDGAGGKGHFYSNKLWLSDKNRIETDEEFQSRTYNDFLGAKEDIEKKIGGKVISFAFPFGDFGQDSTNFSESENIIMRNVSYVYAVSFYQVWAGKGHRFNYPDKKTFLMKRVEVDSEWLGQDLLENLEKGKEKLLAYQDNFNKDNGWQRDWGNLNFKDGSVIISANASTTGSSVFLDGAYLWKDYIFRADINLAKGQTFSLMARYKDGKNYTTCSFSDKSIKVEQILNGERKVLSELKGDFVFIGKNRKVGIEVYGDNIVNCYLDDKIAIKGYDLDKGLDHGGIGFKTWDPLINNSELIVKNVFVEEIK